MSELLTLSEGAVLTHLVTRAELTDGVLLAADDLRLWARLADGAGVPLAVGGLVRTSIDTGAPVLTGPEGWLAGVEPEDMIALRLRDGAFELSITELADFPAERTIRVVQEFGEQALDGLRAFAEGLEPSPGVPIDVVVLELLMKAPRRSPTRCRRWPRCSATPPWSCTEAGWASWARRGTPRRSRTSPRSTSSG